MTRRELLKHALAASAALPAIAHAQTPAPAQTKERVNPMRVRVGMTDTQVRATGRPALTAKLSMSRVGRAKEAGETQGFMKITVDAQTKEILGAAILGLSGDEVIHSILEIMYARKPYTVISNGVHIHPTVSEFLPTLLEGLKPLQ